MMGKKHRHQMQRLPELPVVGEYYGLGHDPAWVYWQTLYLIELKLGYKLKQRPDGKYLPILHDPATGKVIARLKCKDTEELIAIFKEVQS